MAPCYPNELLTANDFEIKLTTALDELWNKPCDPFVRLVNDKREFWKYGFGTSYPTAYNISIERLRNGWVKMWAGTEDNYGWDYEINVECMTNEAVDFREPLSYLKRYIESIKLESHWKLTPETVGT